MTPKGFEQARKAGRYLKDHGFKFDMVFTSVLSRAIESAEIICEDSDNKGIPMEKAWQLNARHPGVLQGLTKEVAVGLYGKEKVNIWRGSYDIMPECVGLDDNRHPVNNPSLGRNKSTANHRPQLLPLGTKMVSKPFKTSIPCRKGHILHPFVPLGSTRQFLHDHCSIPPGPQVRPAKKLGKQVGKKRAFVRLLLAFVSSLTRLCLCLLCMCMHISHSHYIIIICHPLDSCSMH